MKFYELFNTLNEEFNNINFNIKRKGYDFYLDTDTNYFNQYEAFNYIHKNFKNDVSLLSLKVKNKIKVIIALKNEKDAELIKKSELQKLLKIKPTVREVKPSMVGYYTYNMFKDEGFKYYSQIKTSNSTTTYDIYLYLRDKYKDEAQLIQVMGDSDGIYSGSPYLNIAVKSEKMIDKLKDDEKLNFKGIASNLRFNKIKDECGYYYEYENE